MPNIAERRQSSQIKLNYNSEVLNFEMLSEYDLTLIMTSELHIDYGL